MSRLRRQLKPYISALRLSRRELIVFIEGSDFDPVFYGKILQRYGAETGEVTELRRATELPSNAEPGLGGSGGRVQLSQAAELWERYKERHMNTWKNKKALAFCIDKDLDDITGLPDYVSSLIRTPLHSVENHLLLSIDLFESLESCLSLAPGEAKSFAVSAEDWRKYAFDLWREWVIFCLLCRRLEVDRFANYSIPSIFNKPHHMPSDRALSEPHFQRLQQVSGLDTISFTKMRDQISLLVEELFAHNQYDRIFKGRWYVDVLFSQLLSSRWATEARNSGKNGIFIAMRSRFEVRDEDYNYYRDNFLRLSIKA